MNTDPDEKSAVVAEPRDTADAKAVNDLIRGAVNDAASAGVFEKLALAYNTRRMLWAGQTEDGLLPRLSALPKDRKVFTWEGAPDTGVPYADEVVAEHVLIRKSAWNRGEVRLGPRELENADGVQDEEKARAWQKAFEYFVDVDRRSIGYQLGLFATCVEECGYGLLYVDCQRQMRTAKLKVTLGDLVEVVVTQQAEAVMAESGALEMTPEMLQMIQGNAQRAVEEMVLTAGDLRLQELLRQFDPTMPRSEARWAARELRANVKKAPLDGAANFWETSATYYAPQDDGYMPYVEALVPFINCVHGTGLTGAGKDWWFSKPVRLSEADLRMRAAAEQWDEEPGPDGLTFLERVLQQENEFLITDQTWDSRVPRWALSGAGVLHEMQGSDEKFFEVVYVWRQMPDSEGRPMVYHTLVHPRIHDMVGFHECSGLADLPLHVESREEVLFAVQSRGIPEIAVKGGMPAIKVLLDAEGARAQLGSNPPLNRTSDQHVPIEPGKQLFMKRGSENAFMQVPKADQGAMLMLDRLRDQLDRRFFRAELTDPDMKRLYREGVALAAAETIREVVRLMWKVMQGHVDTVKIGRIAGEAVDLELTRDSMQGEVDVRVEFNVDGLSADAQTKTMEWATKLISLGADNLDLNELVNLMARMSNPDLARRIILPADVAAERVRTDQRNRHAQMWGGAPMDTMDYPKKQTGPAIRLEEFQKWKSNPENMMRLQSSEKFAEDMQREEEYLMNQVEQYKMNPARGRAVVPKG
jgi:hypothetical protein